jgi:hypothetical protein
MEKKIISFKGISNVPDDGLNEAGDMSVLLNMRHKGGELVPCQPPAELSGFANIKQSLYHANSKLWLFLTVDGNLHYYEENDWSDGAIYIKSSGVESFAIMGNIVIMNFADGVEYAIWRGKNYEYLGCLPEVKGVTLAESLSTSSNELTTESEYYVRYSDENAQLYNLVVQKGFVDSVLSEVYRAKGYIDYVNFRVGLRAFDGSYIAISEVTNCHSIGAQQLWEKTSSREETSQYKAKVKYFIPKIKVEGIDDKWKDIITSIDVFSTGSVMSFGAKRNRLTRNGVVMSEEYECYQLRNDKEKKEAIADAEFFKVAEYDLDGNVLWEIEDTSPSMIAQQMRLPEVIMHKYISKQNIVINSKLHQANGSTILFNGFPLCSAYQADHLGEYNKNGVYTVSVFIRTDLDEKVVRYIHQHGTEAGLGDYYVYPDNRAYKMEIFKEGDETGISFSLAAHRTRNEAYSVGSKMVGIGGVASVAEIPEINNIVEQPNTLKVSAVDNPFYFPTAQTYKFEGEIVGLASNAEAISPGQFGMFPLYVFTDTGIWAMQVDTSGQGAYTTQSPFSREVCSGAICPVSGGVVFSTDKGVMVISGGQVADLSAALDGFEVDFFKYNADMWNAIFAKAGKGVVNPVPIREYIKGAVLAYNYLYNEIILSNKAKGYSYVYSLTNQVWSVIDTVFDLTTNKYPELVVFDKAQGKMFTFADGGSGIVSVVAITRPFTLGSFDFKRLRQAGLRTTFEGSLNFYLLGSNDGASFVCITGKEAAEVKGENGEVKTYRDLITAMSRSKQYKYFAIAIAGQMSGRVSMAELLVDAGFANNKIR